MKSKKILFFALVCSVAMSFAFAKPKASGDKKLKVVATIFPEYDWARRILGERAEQAELTLLINGGVDLHSYQPTPKDIAKIASADVFIYVGGESDEWVEGVIKSAKNKNLKTLNLLEALGDKVKEEEVVEGMQCEEDEDEDEHEHEHHHEHAKDHDHEHHHEHEHHHDENEEIEYDEHVWLSLKNTKILCGALCDLLCESDSANASIYKKNLDAYVKELSALDSEYSAAVKKAARKTILFGDRFPFRYLTDDYNLSYFAAFVGCSAETEASFKTVIFLAKKVDELSLPCVLTIEKSDQKIAKTIIKNTEKKSAKILSLNSLQSVTADDIKAGLNYIDAMRTNLEVLKSALN